MGSMDIATTAERHGTVVASFPATDADEIMLVTDQGKLIRTEAKQVRIMGRTTQGVRLFDVAEGESMIGAAKSGKRRRIRVSPPPWARRDQGLR